MGTLSANRGVTWRLQQDSVKWQKAPKKALVKQFCEKNFTEFLLEVISKVIQKMTFDAIRKEL